MTQKMSQQVKMYELKSLPLAFNKFGPVSTTEVVMFGGEMTSVAVSTNFGRLLWVSFSGLR
jgi:hypothetical protein